MSWTHVFGSTSSASDLRDQQVELAEDYEAHRDQIEAARELAADVIERGLVGELGDGDAYSVSAASTDSGGVSGVTLTVNKVPAPQPGPDAPPEEVAQPSDPFGQQAEGAVETADQGAGVPGGGAGDIVGGTPAGGSGSDGNAVAGEATGGESSGGTV